MDRLLVTLVCFFILTQSSSAVCPDNHGEALGSYKGITAYSNGSDVSCYDGSTIYGYKWQCVEYVKRFYGEEVGDPITQSWGAAANAYNEGSPSLDKYPQSGTTGPQVGDVLCFDNGGYGHVAIITEVGPNYVKMIDQNRTNSSSNIIIQLSLTESSGHFTVGTFDNDYNVEGWLRDPDYNPTPPTFVCSYVSQSLVPAVVTIGQELTLWVKFKNEGTATWSKTPGADYIELGSCNESATIGESFFNYPCSSAPSWLSCNTPTSFNETSVPPGGTATFTFTGKVRDIGPGIYRVYFGPVYNGAIIPGWSQMQFEVEVVKPDLNADPYADLAILYDYGSCQTRAHMFLSDATKFDYQGNLGWRKQNDYCISAVKFSAKGDFDGDGLDDIAMAYDYGSCRMSIHNFMSNGSSFDYEPYWWDVGGYCAYAIKGMVAGDFNGDGYDDLGFVYNYGGCETRIHILLSNGSTFVYQGSRGWWSAPGWYCASAVHSVVAGDFNGDGKDDIVMGYRYGSSESAFHAFISTGSSFTYKPNWWHVNYFSFNAVPHLAAGDFNGDGKADIMAAYRYGRYSTAFHAFISTGSAFSYKPYWFRAWGWYGLGNVVHLEAGDFNGDGKDDIATAYKYGTCTTKLHRFTSTGSSMSYEGIKWSSSGYCLYATKYMLAGQFNSTGGVAKVMTEGDNPEATLPSTFNLSQNYPNPFNPVTTISYSLPEATQVTLDIFNILGQKVATLVDTRQDAGQHIVTWDAGQHSSGVYLYRLAIGEAVETKKMVLLK